MKINTNQNFKALNTVKKGRTGKTEDKVILGQRDNFNFDDIKNLKSMAGCNTRMTPKEYYTKKLLVPTIAGGVVGALLGSPAGISGAASGAFSVGGLVLLGCGLYRAVVDDLSVFNN